MVAERKQAVLQAYRDFVMPEQYMHIRKLCELAGIEEYPATQAAYNATGAGHLEKHPEEPSSYRINQAGLEWLEEYKRQPKRKKPKPKSKRRSTPIRKVSSNSALDFGSLLEVVALDGKGDYLARNLETHKAYRVSEL